MPKKASTECELLSEPIVIESGFWGWMFGLGNYFAAMGKASVAYNENSIQVSASWKPIMSIWYRETGITRIESVTSGNIHCVYSESKKACEAPILSQLTKQGTPDKFLEAVTDIKHSANGDNLQVAISTQLSLTPKPNPFDTISIGSAQINAKALGNVPNGSSHGSITLNYRCINTSSKEKGKTKDD